MLQGLLKNENRFWTVALLFFIFSKVYLLLTIGIQFADSDQTMQWFAASRFALGDFSTLYFYGQNYNPMLEALFAAPLVRLGIPVWMALPLITSFMSSSMWLILAHLIKREQSKNIASWFLIIAVGFSFEYQWIQSIPRGWMHGLFLAAPGIWLLYRVRNFVAWKALCGAYLSGIFGGLGTFACPNALLLYIPMSVRLLGSGFSRKAIFFQICNAAGFITGYIFFERGMTYFPWHEYVLHWNAPISFEWEYFIHNIKDFFRLFYGAFPLAGVLGFLIIPAMIFTTFLAYRKKNWSEFLLLTSSWMLLLLILFSRKSNNGEYHPYFPYLRFYIALSAVLLYATLNLQWVWFQKYMFHNTTILLVLVVLISGPLVHRIYSHHEGYVRVFRVSNICSVCDSIDFEMRLRKQQKAILYNKADEIAFGCPALGHALQFYYPAYERNKELHESIAQTDTTLLPEIRFESGRYLRCY